jgi:hypothetical protein
MKSGIGVENEEEIRARGTKGKKKMRVIKYRMKERD